MVKGNLDVNTLLVVGLKASHCLKTDTLKRRSVFFFFFFFFRRRMLKGILEVNTLQVVGLIFFFLN